MNVESLFTVVNLRMVTRSYNAIKTAWLPFKKLCISIQKFP